MRARKYITSFVVALGSLFATQQASALTVPGTSDPYLAGMPNGSTAKGGDTAPAQSPVLVGGLPLSGGLILTFGASGGVYFAGGCTTGTEAVCDGPDGGNSTSTGAENGISSIGAPADSLLGLFLDDSQPSLSAAPAGLDFVTNAASRAFTQLSPLLKQVFFIGDGLTGTGAGTTQQFIVPTDATRLFLGTMDGFGWYNNTGSFEVDVSAEVATVPIPAAAVLFPSALLALAGLRRRRA